MQITLETSYSWNIEHVDHRFTAILASDIKFKLTHDTPGRQIILQPCSGAACRAGPSAPMYIHEKK